MKIHCCVIMSFSLFSFLIYLFCSLFVIFYHDWWIKMLGTCEASRIYSNSNRTSRFEFDSKVTFRFENFESAAHAVCRHTTNYVHSLFNKNINLCAVCSWDICLQLHFTCSCTAVARAHTQLPHDNRHWTCKRLPPDSVRDSNRNRLLDSNGNFRFAGP